MNGRFVRIAERERRSFRTEVDGVPSEAAQGDTMLVSLLSRVRTVRDSEFDDGRRAGLCLMGMVVPFVHFLAVLTQDIF